MTDTPAKSGLPEAEAVSRADGSSDREAMDAGHAASTAQAEEMQATADENQTLNAAKLDGLTLAAASVVESQREVAVALLAQEQRNSVATARFRFTALALSIVLLISIAGIYLLLNDAAKSREQLADCIRTSGKCYQEQQARTADVVKIIAEQNSAAAAAASACAQTSTGYEAVKTCVDKALGHR